MSTEWLSLVGLYEEAEVAQDGTVSFAAKLNRWPTDLEREFIQTTEWIYPFTLHLDAEESNSGPRLRVSGARRAELEAVVNDVKRGLTEAAMSAWTDGAPKKSDQQKVNEELQRLLGGEEEPTTKPPLW